MIFELHPTRGWRGRGIPLSKTNRRRKLPFALPTSPSYKAKIHCAERDNRPDKYLNSHARASRTLLYPGAGLGIKFITARPKL